MFFKNCIEKELQKNVKVGETESRAQDVPFVITFYDFCSAGITEKAMGLGGLLWGLHRGVYWHAQRTLVKARSALESKERSVSQPWSKTVESVTATLTQLKLFVVTGNPGAQGLTQPSS